MPLITALPTNNSPSPNDYLVTDNGTTTSKTPISALNIPAVKRTTLTTSGTVTVTFGTYSSALVIVDGYSNNSKTMVLASSATTLTTGVIASSSNIAVTTNGLNLVITNNSSQVTSFVYVILLTGNYTFA